MINRFPFAEFKFRRKLPKIQQPIDKPNLLLKIAQFTWKTGKVEPRPLEDPTHVDERRKAMGMMPLAEYKGMLIKLYKLQDKK